MNAAAAAKDIGDLFIAWWPVLVSVGGVLIAAWRYLLRPRWRALKAFWVRLEAALDQVDRMAKALGDNGGSSLADMIRSTNDRSRLTAARVSYLQNFIERPMFEANQSGIFTRVNSAFELMSGYSNVELVNHGWINLVLPAERNRVIDEWFHAIEDKRVCVIDTPIKTRSGSAIQIQITAFPVIDDGGNKELLSWMGELRIISGS
jgi:PAS domain S-box-containing protein